MPEGGWLAEEKVRFYVGMNDGNCISPFRADKWTRYSGKRPQRLLFVVAPGTIQRGRCCMNDAAGTRPYSGFDFDVARG